MLGPFALMYLIYECHRRSWRQWPINGAGSAQSQTRKNKLMEIKENNQRKSKPIEEQSRSVLHIRCSKEQKARWIACARREGVKLSEYVRRRLPDGEKP